MLLSTGVGLLNFLEWIIHISWIPNLLTCNHYHHCHFFVLSLCPACVSVCGRGGLALCFLLLEHGAMVPWIESSPCVQILCRGTRG